MQALVRTPLRVVHQFLIHPDQDLVIFERVLHFRRELLDVKLRRGVCGEIEYRQQHLLYFIYGQSRNVVVEI